jgi:hypothetical protein
LLPEAVEVITLTPVGASFKLVGRGLSSNQVRQPILTLGQIAQLTVSPAREPFDGDPAYFRLGIEAQRLGLAYEYEFKLDVSSSPECTGTH